MGILVFQSLTQVEEKIPRFVRAAGWRGTNVHRYMVRLYPVTLSMGFMQDIEDKKKASILKPRNLCNQFWNLQLKGYQDLFSFVFQVDSNFENRIFLPHPVCIASRRGDAINSYKYYA
eukprot:SAG11_NODE_815_length_7030_cov_23.197807_2_plen_118_part_00